jgi:UDP-N-acetylglucosamine--N-acetylmuramyl-(pentapeptide) pyrophosphoryl-undecaprenol N-acetylglucosamine transferase
VSARRIALVVGDTHGHFYPALAVTEAYRRRGVEVEILLFGPLGLGADLAAHHHLGYRPVSATPLVRVGLDGQAAALGRTLAGIVQARRALRAFRARLVMGFGSYASGAVLLAARSLGVATVIHEGNARPGLANRLLGRVIDRVHLGQATTGRFFPPERQCLTGWPVRLPVRALADVCRRPPGRGRPTRVLVYSGSRGGAFLAREVPALLERMMRGRALEVHHQAADAAPLRDAYARASIPARVSAFIDDPAAAYRWADLAVTRAGAGTIAELAVAGLPSLLVPLADAARDHQRWNAEAFGASGAALWVRERDWDRTALAARLSDLLDDPVQWAAMSAAARGVAVPAAADAVVDQCEALMDGRW